MLLHHLPYGHHGAKVRLALLEKGLAHELPPLPGGSTRAPEHLALSPPGEVPQLVDGELRLGESEVIVEHLEEIAPDPALVPRGAAARARSRWRTRFHDLRRGVQRSALLFTLRARRRDDPAMAAELAERDRLTGVLEASIAPSRLLFGSSFDAAGAACSLGPSHLRVLPDAYGRPAPETRAPRLARRFEVVSARPSVARVTRGVGGRAAPNMDDCEAALAGG